MNPSPIFPLLAVLSAIAALPAAAADRYEAEGAILDVNTIQKVAHAAASGGFYVSMREGNLAFKVAAATAGFYTLWAHYAQPNDAAGKVQNLAINGAAKGQISFPYTVPFVSIKASAKIKLEAGPNTIEIQKSWGWVDIDYIELTPYVATPFSIPGSLVTPGASENACKVYGFLRENFQKKTVSGFMTNTVMQNDGKYTPSTLENQTESAWIFAAAGKYPALMGLDLFHATGLNSTGEWHQGNARATVAMAEDMFRRGGIPIFCWHWKDPLQAVEAFYSPSSNSTPFTSFNLNRAFQDSTSYAAFNTSSPEYAALIKDMDMVAGHLKTLADKGVPVLWRPLHEASGRWFWWGYRGPGACKALWKLMFDRFTVHHGLKNLIWVWTSDEAGDALSWYPGDEYVDIVGRDYYYYPRIANHGSLVASYEKLKDIFGGRKIIALTENGSIPHPDSMKVDGAGWSFFMPWYGDYTMDGWAHDNTAADWKSVLAHEDVITLDEMPGWAGYVPPMVRVAAAPGAREGFAVRHGQGILEIDLAGMGAETVELLDLRGARVAVLNPRGPLAPGLHRFDLDGRSRGMHVLRVKASNGSGIRVKPVVLSGR